MFLKKVDIENFRNIKNEKIHFTKNLVYLIGENAQGKTNILEALYLLCLLRSFRTPNVKELLLFNENYFSITGTFIDNNNIQHTISIKYIKSQKKEVTYNNKRINRYSDYIGKFPAVLFSANDFEIISGQPSLRRKIFNIIISQCSKNYLYHLKAYDHVIKQRNRILYDIFQSKKFHANELESWNEQLIRHSEAIIHLRQKYIDDINKIIKENLSNLKWFEPIEIEYQPNFSITNGEDFKSFFKKKLNEIFLKEVKCNFSLCGPHRDEFLFFLRNKNAKHFGSRGEQKSILISLKAAECELIREKLGISPIIILDDLFSEFDRKRSEMIIELFYPKGQCFISGTELDKSKFNDRDKQVLYIENGRVKP